MLRAWPIIWHAYDRYGKFKPYTGFLYQREYTLLSVQVQKAVMEPEVFDEALATKVSAYVEHCF